MSLDVYLARVQPVQVYEGNITHNLAEMAEAAGIYRHLWKPEELGITKAGDLVLPLREGLRKLESDAKHYATLVTIYFAHPDCYSGGYAPSRKSLRASYRHLHPSTRRRAFFDERS